jgi:hypothetical protein
MDGPLAFCADRFRLGGRRGACASAPADHGLGIKAMSSANCRKLPSNGSKLMLGLISSNEAFTLLKRGSAPFARPGVSGYATTLQPHSVDPVCVLATSVVRRRTRGYSYDGLDKAAQ